MASVFCYIPNLIGYLRLILLLVAWIFFDKIVVFLPLYIVSALLDCVDGIVARRLKQTSEFGAWLDVLIDNIGRSIIWARLPYSWGVFVLCVEWSVFVCTHTSGHAWKNSFGSAPWWVKSVMENGFYSVMGLITISGLHGLPPYLYFYNHVQLHPELFPQIFQTLHPLLVLPVVALGAGRLLCMAVEVWCIREHALHLAHREVDNQVNSLTKELDKTDS
ncbi:uncharacterized protein LOC135340487 [Halichondria panicea]|uniref:uncharacterized protein LOC135340487 n=1 Tax=Halichondria panicea TaxID=6063 RepID=UPI00312B7B05